MNSQIRGLSIRQHSYIYAHGTGDHTISAPTAELN